MTLVYYVFDLLHLDGRDTASLPLIERKALLKPLIAGLPGLQFNDHETGDGELIRRHACDLGFEGVVSKTVDAPYAPGNRGLWRKSKCFNRQEFVVVGWTDPEGSRPHLGALLLGYYTDDGKLIYAGRVGTGMPDKVLADLRRRLEPLARPRSPLSAPPPRKTRFGSPLVLSRVHWVEPQLVAEITYLTWTGDGLLRQRFILGSDPTSPQPRFGRRSRERDRGDFSPQDAAFDGRNAQIVLKNSEIGPPRKSRFRGRHVISADSPHRRAYRSVARGKTGRSGRPPKEFLIEAASGLLNCDQGGNSSFSTQSTR